MRRLLGYPAAVSSQRRRSPARASSVTRVVELAPPMLTKLVLDRYIPPANVGGLARIAAGLPRRALAVVRARLPADLDDADDGASGSCFDLRMQIQRHLQRLDIRFFDRNPWAA
jgi:hypothetical protein